VFEAPEESADFDADGVVDGSDFLAWQRNLGTYVAAMRADGDANADGNVLADDLAVWRATYGGESAVSSSSQSASPQQDATITWLALSAPEMRGDAVTTRRSAPVRRR
jgi:hypothetical protein